MGWSFTHGATKQSIIDSILKPWDFTVAPEDARYYTELKPGDRNQSVVLKHKLAGNSLWYLRQTIITKADGIVNSHKWIGVSLLECSEGDWGHKDMDISMGPYASGCPKEWANEIPTPDPNADPYAYDFLMKLKGWKVNRCETCRKLRPSEDMLLLGGIDNLCRGHDEEIIVMAAWGDWHEDVPKGQVGVVACKGGRINGQYASEELYFLIPSEEYEKRNPCGYTVVDTDRHPVWITKENRKTKEVVLA